MAVQYDATYYAQFSPQTALDMIRQTPGFVLDERKGDARRGFEGSVGNVLIDGERPTAKTDGVNELLRGIPAVRVKRIEILRAADTVGDASGTRVLANVVLQPAPWQGAWSGGAEIANRHRPAPNGWAALSGAIGATDVVLNASSYSLFRDLPGTRTARDHTGAVLVTRHAASPRHYHEYGGGGQLVRRIAGGRLEATTKTKLAWYDDATSLVTEESPSTERVPYAQHERSTEAGVSYKRPIHSWELTALALYTAGHFASRVTATTDAGPPVSPLVTQTARRSTTELVLRTVGARLRPRRTSQIGLESVRNTLDGLSTLRIDFGAGDIDLPLANPRVRVTEDRGELFASEAWRVSDRWTIDGRIGVEYSRLKFLGDVSRAVTLVYAKPSTSVTRTFGTKTQVFGRVFRTVGQLHFADFVATASLVDQQQMGANPTLRPESSWRAEGGADFRFGTESSLNVVVFRDWLDDVVDWTVWGEGELRVDARGNIGLGRTVGTTVSYRSPIPWMAGMSVSATVTALKLRAMDPLTEATRAISEREPARVDTTLRQNLPRGGAIGASYTYRAAASAYRLKEIDWKRESPELEGFFEWPLPRSLRLRLQADSILGSPARRRRTFFAPNRTDAISGTERIESRPGHWWVMSVTGSF